MCVNGVNSDKLFIRTVVQVTFYGLLTPVEFLYGANSIPTLIHTRGANYFITAIYTSGVSTPPNAVRTGGVYKYGRFRYRHEELFE